MNRITSPPLLKGIMTLLTAACALATVPATAQEQLLDLEMEITKKTVSLGEPIILDYKIINSSSSDEAYIHLGEFSKWWLTISLVDEAGREAPAIKAIPPPGKQALQGRAAFISPMSGFPGHFIVNQWFVVSRPGNYRLNVHARLNYVLGSHARRVTQEQLAKGSDTALTRDYSFPIVVTRREPARLRAVAESLRAALSEAKGHQTRRLVEALFTMPAAYAAPSWQELINDPERPIDIQSSVTGRLARFPSLEAADFLTWIAWSSKIPEHTRPGVKNILRRFHEKGNANLKQHVEQIFIRIEGKMPPHTPTEYGY